MLQVKDPQEVFDEIVRTAFQAKLEEGEELPLGLLNNTYSIFILGEMYGTVSTCLAQNIPIPKKLWDNPTVQSFVRGDVDDVVVIHPDTSIRDAIDDAMHEKLKASGFHF